MSSRIKALMPLAVAVAVLTFVWLEVSLNFTFHWVTDGDLGIGLSLPSNFHLVPPAAFISWAVFFAAGANRRAFTTSAIAVTIGAAAALVLMVVAPAVADLPDFWGIATVTAVIALIAVLASAAGEWYFTPGVFAGFASVVFWWVATGLDGWAENGGGIGNSLQALSDPATAGSGAFGGVISTPVPWVFASVVVTLLCGCVLGIASVTLAGVLTPSASRAADAQEPATA
jgi:hypothetical protein